MKSFVKNIAIIFIILLLSNCDFFLQTFGAEIHIRFREINFSGDWSHYNGNINEMEVALLDDIYFKDTPPIRLKQELSYFSDSTPYLPSLNTEQPIVFRTDKYLPRLQKIVTDFYRDGVSENSISYDSSQYLNTGTVNDIALFYDMRNTTQVDFSATIKSNDAIFRSYEDIYYNFDVNCKQIKQSNFDISDSINIVVMGDGYRIDQMDYYREYVEDAFKDWKNLHYTKQRLNTKPHDHVPNVFFESWWKRINVFSYETISPVAGIETKFLTNGVMSFFSLNRIDKSRASTSRMKKIIDENFHKTNLSRENIDVYIIFANDEKISTYSFTHFLKVDDDRNDQNVTWVVIRAPVGYNVEDTYFHHYVSTDAIAHELGHAIAELQDEYPIDSNFFRFYLHEFRNISPYGHGRFKWMELINVDPNYYDISIVTPPNIHNKLTHFLYPVYFVIDEGYRQFYIPTWNSTMRGGQGGSEPKPYHSDNYQYGPVNTYFMEGSFKVRIGQLPPQNPADIFGTGNQRDYQWNGYSFRDFHKDWDPSKFN